MIDQTGREGEKKKCDGFLDKIGCLKRLLSFFCVYGYSRVFRLDELILDNVFSFKSF